MQIGSIFCRKHAFLCTHVHKMHVQSLLQTRTGTNRTQLSSRTGSSTLKVKTSAVGFALHCAESQARVQYVVPLFRVLSALSAG